MPHPVAMGTTIGYSIIVSNGSAAGAATEFNVKSGVYRAHRQASKAEITGNKEGGIWQLFEKKC